MGEVVNQDSREVVSANIRHHGTKKDPTGKACKVKESGKRPRVAINTQAVL